jgi:hypothetical protein
VAADAGIADNIEPPMANAPTPVRKSRRETPSWTRWE